MKANAPQSNPSPIPTPNGVDDVVSTLSARSTSIPAAVPINMAAIAKSKLVSTPAIITAVDEALFMLVPRM
jgi:hypothetical protein